MMGLGFAPLFRILKHDTINCEASDPTVWWTTWSLGERSCCWVAFPH